MRLHAEQWNSDEADGTTVICLHGITSWSRRFHRLATLRMQGRKVVALDLRGHGSSGWEPPWNIATHLKDIIDTVTGPAVWIGHSFGGRLIVELASVKPELVDRAILLDPAVRVSPQDAYAQAEAVRCGARYESTGEYVRSRLSGGTIYRATGTFLTEELADDLVPADDSDGGYVPKYCPSAAVVGWSEMATNSSPMPACPTLVVTGEQSWMSYTAEPSQNLAVVRVPGGHSLLWDAFDETADAICSFLDSSRPETGP